ncbi:MAG: hypothetical protein P8166_04825 [Candidatus Thiodiazotropha sp.]
MNHLSSMKYLRMKSLIFLVASLFSFPIFAGSFTYDLVRTSTLTNVDDAEGRWQFSGGKVYIGNSHVGYFVSKKRVSFGASAVNRAALETTIIWKYGDHNITVQGTHYFGTGAEEGSVSAASSAFSYLKGANVSGTHQHLTFTY